MSRCRSHFECEANQQFNQTEVEQELKRYGAKHQVRRRACSFTRVKHADCAQICTRTPCIEERVLTQPRAGIVQPEHPRALFGRSEVVVPLTDDDLRRTGSVRDPQRFHFGPPQ